MGKVGIYVSVLRTFRLMVTKTAQSEGNMERQPGGMIGSCRSPDSQTVGSANPSSCTALAQRGFVVVETQNGARSQKSVMSAVQQMYVEKGPICSLSLNKPSHDLRRLWGKDEHATPFPSLHVRPFPSILRTYSYSVLRSSSTNSGTSRYPYS